MDDTDGLISAEYRPVDSMSSVVVYSYSFAS